MIREVIGGSLPNVVVEDCSPFGRLCPGRGRGGRLAGPAGSVSFEYEFQMALAKKLNPTSDTVF